MRSLRRALLWASVAGVWLGCSVNQSGLTDGGGVNTGSGGAAGGGGNPAGRGGSGGSTGGAPTGTAGSSAGAGGGAAGTSSVGGTGGMATGAAGSGGSGATAGGGGNPGIAGSVGGGGAGNPGIAGSVGGGGAGVGGVGGATAGSAGGTTGTAGNGGSTAGSSGAAGTGGDGASGGRGGRGGTDPAGNGGRGGMGGRGGAGPGGRGGNGGNPCSMYPSARAFTPPTDTRVHCYWARTSSQTWSEAQQSCNIQNGYLVSILSAEENAFVVSMAAFSSSFNDTWIGATDNRAGGDRNGPGTYRWVSNEPWGYTSWESGQPDGFCDPCSAGQTCTCDHRGVLASDGTWNDRWQDNSRSSVCEAVPN